MPTNDRSNATRTATLRPSLVATAAALATLAALVKDTKKGQTNGEELDAFGAEWYALSPAGANVEKNSGGSYGG